MCPASLPPRPPWPAGMATWRGHGCGPVGHPRPRGPTSGRVGLGFSSQPPGRPGMPGAWCLEVPSLCLERDGGERRDRQHRSSQAECCSTRYPGRRDRGAEAEPAVRGRPGNMVLCRRRRDGSTRTGAEAARALAVTGLQEHGQSSQWIRPDATASGSVLSGLPVPGLGLARGWSGGCGLTPARGARAATAEGRTWWDAPRQARQVAQPAPSPAPPQPPLWHRPPRPALLSRSAATQAATAVKWQAAGGRQRSAAVPRFIFLRSVIVVLQETFINFNSKSFLDVRLVSARNSNRCINAEPATSTGDGPLWGLQSKLSGVSLFDSGHHLAVGGRAVAAVHLDLQLLHVVFFALAGLARRLPVLGQPPLHLLVQRRVVLAWAAAPPPASGTRAAVAVSTIAAV